MIAKVRWWEVVAALALLAFLGTLVLFPVYAGGGPARRSLCLLNVKQSGVALLTYASDVDDRLPPRDRWMDATLPYVKHEEIWHCPSASKGAYGYAYNGALSYEKQGRITDPVRTPMVYDSVNPIRNASDLCASLPLPGRHGRKEEGGRNNVGYVDGHAKGVPARAVVH